MEFVDFLSNLKFADVWNKINSDECNSKTNLESISRITTINAGTGPGIKRMRISNISNDKEASYRRIFLRDY